ncbi:MAG: O-antigen ligase family protein [Thiotrichales bacterium]
MASLPGMRRSRAAVGERYSGLSPVTPWIVVALALVIIRPQEYVPLLFGLPILNSALVLATVAWAVAPGKRFDSRQLLVVGLLSAVIVISSLINSGVAGVDHVVKTYIPGAWLLLLIVTSARSSADLRLYWEAIALFGVFIVLHTIHIYHHGIGWTGIEVLVEHGVKRGIYVGIFRDPNDLGMFLVSLAPVYIMWLRRSQGALELVVHALLLLLLAYAIYLTNSRGALIGLGVIALLVLYKRYGTWVAVSGGMMLPILIAVVSVRVTQDFGSDASAVGRLDSWYAGVHMFFANPIFGVGYDRFVEFNWLTAHNSFILILAEAGILGYILWTALLLLNAVGLARVFRITGTDAAPLSVVKSQKYGVSRVGKPTVQAGSAREGTETQTTSVGVERERVLELGEISFLALVGLMICAFFLSQSYSIYLFVLHALAAVSLRLAIENTPPGWLGNCELSIGHAVVYSMISVVGLVSLVWVLIRVFN